MILTQAIKINLNFFYYPSFKSVTCVGYALEEQFLIAQQPSGNEINLGNEKNQIDFYNLGQNQNLGHEQFYNLGHDL